MWHSEFKSLFEDNQQQTFDTNFLTQVENYTQEHENSDTEQLNEQISKEEINSAVHNAKRNKATGLDNVPLEVLINPICLEYMQKNVNACFNSGKTPRIWTKNIIHPIPKGSTSDPNIPLSHQGLHLIPAICKLYSSVLNSRLATWAEDNNVLVEEQNGFRKKRGCDDHLYVLSTILETKLKQKKPVFACYIDAHKAFDRVNHSLLWYRLLCLGIRGNMYRAIKSLYHDFECCVNVGGTLTDLFDVNIGVKQGCQLSPLLFAFFINTLAEEIKETRIGVKTGDNVTGILLYADDVVLMAETGEELQILLNVLSKWCNKWRLTINISKTKVVHYRPSTHPRSTFQFSCGKEKLEIVQDYKYLGLVFDEHLKWEKTVRYLADSATRALECIIAKSKVFGGLPYNVYKTLYDSMVSPILEYGSHIWGQREFKCVNNVFYRANRYFMAVGKYMPNLAVLGEMGWEVPLIKQWANVVRYWHKLNRMDIARLPRKYMEGMKSRNTAWYKRLKDKLDNLRLLHITDHNYMKTRSKKYVVQEVKTSLSSEIESDWYDKLHNDKRQNPLLSNKLRTYRRYKTSIYSEPYIVKNINRAHRRALAQFRGGTAPLRIETDRYSKQQYIPVSKRLCQMCSLQKTEDEMHALCECPLYDDLRESLYEFALSVNADFSSKDCISKFSYLMSNELVQKETAKTCFLILKKRRDVLEIQNSLS
jgi:hypothetical protein